MDLHELVRQIEIILSNRSGKVSTMVREREAFIDLLAPDGRHDPDFVLPGYKKIEITIKVT